MPLVSIIMPNYNAGEYIAEAILSVINQTFIDWELIICDDESTDNSAIIAQEFMLSDSRISLIKNNYAKGAPGARNSCLELSKGRFIAFLDSDDLWLPNKLSSQIDFMKTNNITFSFSYYNAIDESGNYLASYKAPKRVDASLIRFFNFIPCLTAMYDTKVLGKVDQPNMQMRNDFALWLKILNSGKVDYAYCLPVVTANYRENSYGLTRKKMGNIYSLYYYYKKTLIELGGVSAFGSEIYTMLYIILGTMKKKLTSLYNYLVVRL